MVPQLIIKDTPPFSQFEEGRRNGQIKPYFLGLGFEPLTWKAQLYTVCVFDEHCFDQIFPGMIVDNEEGILELPTTQRTPEGTFIGWPFDATTVRGYINQENFGPSGRANLMLALKHREALMI